MKVDYRPVRYEFRPVRAGRGGGFRLERSDIRYERSDFGLVRADFRPERAASMLAGLRPKALSVSTNFYMQYGSNGKENSVLCYFTQTGRPRAIYGQQYPLPCFA